eukprot:CAMPEP_0203762438 /NCGR_PEP_ID=MMETSP0098-20131031/15330_1 /ASSEMBLY_ACC=CAM_ASM_000208 /TAXON_ID=96639 /ORGANISM=" , Strain NY0313808BC1" /LENGTH=236 /DNA_ID=CAMNT_0050656853 /DNA_START=183 /DNA_END=890 /DNA_ORIENTATION=+
MPTSRLLIIRHGDRFDYANPEWKVKASALGLNARDPPLSDLGHVQAEQAARYVEENVINSWDSNVDMVLSSPYLRAMQTAQPLARRLGVKIRLEDGLSETHHAPGTLPHAQHRWAYFPSIDLEYESLYDVKPDCQMEGKALESYPRGYMSRMICVADTFSEQLQGKNVVCFTHAASTALVCSLVKQHMPEDTSMKFAPCGIFHLEKEEGETQYRLISCGSDNTKYIHENTTTTHPW